MDTHQQQERAMPATSYTQTHPTGGGGKKARKQRIMEGFSECSSSDGLTDEQERKIAENIYDWWISGMSYKKWYAKKFLQYQFNFSDKEYETE